jgi:7-cyano-7-deazaguanine synthase
VNFAYGQRHSREIVASTRICEHYNLAYPITFNLAQAFRMTGGSSLTSGVNEGNPSEEHVLRTADALPSTFVPGRNIIMLSFAAALAYTERAQAIYGGWNQLDYSGYPDCRTEFLLSMEDALAHGLDLPPGALAIRAPLVSMSKAEIIQLGQVINAPLHLTWSCYAGGSAPCGECDSCKIRIAGFATLGVPDPALEAL